MSSLVSFDLGSCGTVRLLGSHPRHELHEDGEGLLMVVPQRAVVLNDALVMQILQQLDFTLQSTDLLQRDVQR